MGDGGIPNIDSELRISPDKLLNEEDVTKEIIRNNQAKITFSENGKTTIPTKNPNVAYWKATKIRIKDGQLRKIAASIKRIKKIIEKTRVFISQVRKFSELLKRLEEIVASPITTLIDMIQEKLRLTLREIGSTGVYVLSTHEYTSLGKKIVNETTKTITDEATAKILQDKNPILQNLWTVYRDKLDPVSDARSRDILRTTEDPEAANITDFSIKFRSQDEKGTLTETTYSFGNHIPLLYSEFIEVIALSFLDANDRPDGDFLADYLVRRDPNPDNANPLTIGEWAETKYPDNVINKNKGEAFFRAGRPFVGNGTKMNVMIIAFAVPDFGMFFANITTLATIFGSIFEQLYNTITPAAWNTEVLLKDMQIKQIEKEISDLEVHNQKLSMEAIKVETPIDPISNSKQDIETARLINAAGKNQAAQFRNQIEKNKQEIKNLEEKKKKLVSERNNIIEPLELAGKITERTADLWGQITESYRRSPTTQPDSDTNTSRLTDLVNQRKTAAFITDGGEKPDFYGVTLNSLFRPLFILFENLISKLEGLKTTEMTLSKLVNEVLGEIEKKLGDLEAIVELLEKILRQIQALLALNLSVLKVSTTKGNFDIYEKIINSKGFPSETVETPMYHYGIAIAYVEPSLNSAAIAGASSHELRELFKSTQAEFDAETGEILSEAKDGIATIENIIGIKNPSGGLGGGGFGSVA